MSKHLSFLRILPLAMLGLLLNLTPSRADEDLETGFYFITNVSDETKALWGRYPYLGWNTLDKTQPGFVFYIEKAPTETNNNNETVTDNYYLQCVDYSAWFYGVPAGYVTTLTKDRSERRTVRFAKLSDGNYSFQPTTLRFDFKNLQLPQNNFFGVESDHKTYSVDGLSQWTSNGNLKHWKLTKLTADELQTVLNNLLSQTLMEAYSTYNTATASFLGTDKLITEGTSSDAWGTGSQFFGPEEPSASVENSSSGAYSAFSYLIDGNMTNRYQATWQAAVHAAPQFLQVDLGEGKTVNAFRLHYGKNGYWPSRSVWRDITLYATNDASIALDQTASTKSDIASNTSWHKIGSYRFPTDQIINPAEATANERDIDKYYKLYEDERYIDIDFAWAGDAYRYLRFYVDEPLLYNNATGKDFTLSELQIYERKEPAIIHSKQIEAQALSSAISTAENKLSSGTATSDDIKTLQEAIDKMSEEAGVTIGSIGYASFVSDIAVQIPSGLTAYIVTDLGTTEATLYEVAKEGDVLPAGTPVFLKGTAGETYILPASSGTTIDLTSYTNLLKGSATEHTAQTDGTKYYVLTAKSRTDNTPVIKRLATGENNYIPAGYAYLTKSDAQQSPAFFNISFNTTEGINAVKNATDSENITYDLEGRRVTNPHKGIYIKDGKKVVLK